MAGIEENVAMNGDWLAPSPSPRTFFSAMLGEEFSSRSATMESSRNNQEPFLERFMESSEAMEGMTPPSSGSSFSEHKSNSRAGLGERIAARAGFNAPRLNTESIRTSDLLIDSDSKSPLWTIPPGLSPTTLLDSPVFLSNSLVQPSPTTGKLPFFTSDNIMSSSLMLEANNRSKDHLFNGINSPPFSFKPGDDMRSPLNLGAMAPTAHPQPTFPAEASVQSENSMKSHNGELSKPPSKGHRDFSPDRRFFDSIDEANKHSPPLDEDAEQRATGESVVPNNCGAPSDDEYNWRKYGQKQVKGSEYPRSYYKCTHPNCQVKKKVERSYEGHITEIIYKGTHNHSKPLGNRCNSTQKDINEQAPNCENDLPWMSLRKGALVGASDWRIENPEVSSTLVGPEYVNQSSVLHPQNGSVYEQGEAVDVSSTFSNDEDEEDRGTHGSVSIGHEGEGDESESKRRKIEVYASEMSGAARAIREPRVVVQTTSEVDILDDGYRWRKYGQKVVKGNPNPRSYYKCTAAGCTVRKHVERASHDLKSVITTYEGKHNHDVPAARNSSHMNAPMSGSVVAQVPALGNQTHGHRPEPTQAHLGMGRFDRPPQLGPFGLAGRQQVGPPLPGHGFGYVMNHPPSLPNLALPMVGHPGPVKFPILPFHPYMGQHRPGEEMKVEPMTEAVYQQIMSRLPLGPHV